MSTTKGKAIYMKVQQNLMDNIQAGVYGEGAKLPTEDELCGIHKVSRPTVRRALQQLELAGLIKKIHGKGTFVTPDNSQIIHRLQAPMISYPEHMQALRRRSETSVLASTVISADANLSEHLHVPAQSPLTKLVRLRVSANVPVSYEVSYIPWQLAPGLSNDICNGSLYEQLRENYGLQIDHSIDTLEPIIADDAIAQLLQIAPGKLSFQLKTISYLADQTPFEYNESILRSDTSKFIIERRHT
ncbi:GntR family transcriptional regulator [Paenibacillus sp. SYP-B3998]|uniref:GntR family transcriptional regulator n=1 Tax=Paenibacillus sp. SYP-B3998 TaxID=2678564 RepID=A0A6G3ZRU3_9BACL|nr:GntR family transcriptional regulator [Paenibacillus sp. SYP-B3998]NEW04923.1 GntR family transcriptional regulator [Paenibacillus sp. SYP-B3998]